MSKILIFLFFLFLFVLQLTVLPFAKIFNVIPDILIAAILVFAVMKRRPSFFMALSVGLAMDLFSNLPFGVYSLGFVLIVWLVEFVGKPLFKINDFSGQISLIAGACLAWSLISVLLIKLLGFLGLGSSVYLWQNFLRFGLIEFILNLIICLVFLFIAKKMHGLFDRS